MSIAAGDCFVAFTSSTEHTSVIFGRISLEAGNEPQEVHYYGTAESLDDGKCDGGIEIGDIRSSGETYALILQKPAPAFWGGDYGSNEKNVSVGISWSAGEPEVGSVKSTDLVRIALAKASNAEEAVEQIRSIVEENGSDSAKFSFVVCDPSEVWFISTAGKIWAGQRIVEGTMRAPSDGLAVSTAIDKSSPNLGDTLKTLGLWDGEGDLNFAKCFEASSNQSSSFDEHNIDGAISMFELLRSTATDANRSATVSVLSASGISCHWFTATPNPRESVFKPFVFAPNPKISPLTKLLPNENVTLLHKLHAQRKPEAIDDLKNLEAKCVEEVDQHLQENPTPTNELDELMKDCVEAEVKFYR